MADGNVYVEYITLLADYNHLFYIISISYLTFALLKAFAKTTIKYVGQALPGVDECIYILSIISLFALFYLGYKNKTNKTSSPL